VISAAVPGGNVKDINDEGGAMDEVRGVGRAMFAAMSYSDGPDHLTVGKGDPTPAGSPAGPAAREMQMLAEDHRKANPRLSPEGAYAHVYTHPDNTALREKCKAEHMAAMAAA